LSDTHTNPAEGFAHFGLATPLLRAIAASGFETPRPIQTETLPAALAGRDVLGLAETGTGKTAAFALPLLERLLAGGAGHGPRALVLAPTRELAAQIDSEMRALARFTRLRTVTVFGGVSSRTQISALRRAPEIVVACPGRLLDLHGQGALRLDAIELLVLDEADHMFDMGFLPSIRRVLAALPARRQNLLFSATMPAAVRRLADAVLRDPHVVQLGRSAPAATIEHVLHPVAEGHKLALLKHLLREDRLTSAIVFTRTKHRARRLGRQLEEAGHRAVSLQGNLSQPQRERAMRGFRERRFDVLVATDIAARGIDVSQVSHVINFDVPNVPEAYTHRLGRTGRSERKGRAHTFATADDARLVRAIERMLGAPIERSGVPDVMEGLPVRTGAAREAAAAAATPRDARPGRGRRRGGARWSRRRDSARPAPAKRAGT
jgi:ATP-dependent RNA helicase RhlE